MDALRVLLEYELEYESDTFAKVNSFVLAEGETGSDED